MLWDLIRDFFVQHIFGGWTSDELSYSGFLGYLQSSNNQGGFAFDTYYTDSIGYAIGTDINSSVYQNTLYMSLGDWLSTTATIISISIIVVLCCLFVYKIIKLIGGLIR